MIRARGARCDTFALIRRTTLVMALAALFGVAGHPADAQSPDPLPELTGPVNDFAHVIDAASAAEIDRVSRALQTATGDVVVVATVATFQPYGDIREMAVKMFENHGRGIGQKGQDNGLLVLVAVNDRKVTIEVGYGLEQWITDGYSGETIRQVIAPEFRAGRYGPGLRAGVARLAGRIAQARNVSLEGVPPPAPVRPPGQTPTPFWVILLIFIAILVVSRIGGGSGRRRTFWGGGPWSGWSSGVGPFGGGWGGGGFGGGGGGGFGGGFGGFGGGGSGGGGASGSW